VAAKPNSRQVALLLSLLAVLVVVVIVRVRPAMVQSVTGGGEKAADVGRYKVPALGWDKDTGRVLPTPRSGRSLFGYGAPPTPTPDRRPTPTPRPTRIPEQPEPLPTPTPAPWGNLPPPPQFTLSFIGWLGPDRLPIAVFREGEEVYAVATGERFRDKFIIRAVGPNDVTLGYVGYPDSITSKVSVAR
jgi:hypothetical protein